jgi:aldehyde dehydrogenase (NAD+)
VVWQGKFDKLYIGGMWVEPATDELITCISPFSEEPFRRHRADVARGRRGTRSALVPDELTRKTWPQTDQVVQFCTKQIAPSSPPSS